MLRTGLDHAKKKISPNTNVYSTNKYYLHLAKAEKRQDVVGGWWCWWCWRAAAKEKKSAAVQRVSIFIVMWHWGRSSLLDPIIFLIQCPDLVEDVCLQVKARRLELQPRWGPPRWWRWRWPWSSAGTGGPGRGAGCHSPASPSQSVSWSPGAPTGRPHDSVPLPVDLWNRRERGKKKRD